MWTEYLHVIILSISNIFNWCTPSSVARHHRLLLLLKVQRKLSTYLALDNPDIVMIINTIFILLHTTKCQISTDNNIVNQLV